MKIIFENPAFSAWFNEISISVSSFGPTFANCFILPPNLEDIPATMYTSVVGFIEEIGNFCLKFLLLWICEIRSDLIDN